MPTRSIVRRPAVLGSVWAETAAIYVDSDDNRLKVIPAGSGSTEVIVQEANGAAVQEVLITTETLTAADSGKTFFLALVGGFTTTLPAPVLGLNYKFFVQVAPTTAYIIITASAAKVLGGQVYASAGSDEDSNTGLSATSVNFVANTAVIGDSAELYCDGTSWYVRAYCNAAGGITITGE